MGQKHSKQKTKAKVGAFATVTNAVIAHQHFAEGQLPDDAPPTTQTESAAVPNSASVTESVPVAPDPQIPASDPVASADPISSSEHAEESLFPPPVVHEEESILIDAPVAAPQLHHELRLTPDDPERMISQHLPQEAELKRHRSPTFTSLVRINSTQSPAPAISTRIRRDSTGSRSSFASGSTPLGRTVSFERMDIATPPRPMPSVASPPNRTPGSPLLYERRGSSPLTLPKSPKTRDAYHIPVFTPPTVPTPTSAAPPMLVAPSVTPATAPSPARVRSPEHSRPFTATVKKLPAKFEGPLFQAKPAAAATTAQQSHVVGSSPTPLVSTTPTSTVSASTPARGTPTSAIKPGTPTLRQLAQQQQPRPSSTGGTARTQSPSRTAPTSGPARNSSPTRAIPQYQRSSTTGSSGRGVTSSPVVIRSSSPQRAAASTRTQTSPTKARPVTAAEAQSRRTVSPVKQPSTTGARTTSPMKRPTSAAATATTPVRATSPSKSAATPTGRGNSSPEKSRTSTNTFRVPKLPSVPATASHPVAVPAATAPASAVTALIARESSSPARARSPTLTRVGTGVSPANAGNTSPRSHTSSGMQPAAPVPFIRQRTGSVLLRKKSTDVSNVDKFKAAYSRFPPQKLLSLTKSHDDQERLAALHVLKDHAATGDQQMQDELMHIDALRTLLEVVDSDRNESVLELALQTVLSLCSKGTLQRGMFVEADGCGRISKMLRIGSGSLVVLAARIVSAVCASEACLTELRNASAHKHLIKLLENPHSDAIIECAALAVASFASKVSCVDALISVGAVLPLLTLLGHDSENVRELVAIALRGLASTPAGCKSIAEKLHGRAMTKVRTALSSDNGHISDVVARVLVTITCFTHEERDSLVALLGLLRSFAAGEERLKIVRAVVGLFVSGQATIPTQVSLPDLHFLIQLMSEDGRVAEQAALLLAQIIATGREATEAFKSASGVAAMIRCLASASSAPAHANAALAVANFVANDAEGGKSVVQLMGLKAMLAALGTERDIVCERVLLVLASLAIDEDNAGALCAEPNFERVFTQLHTRSTGCVSQAMHTFAALSTSEIGRSVLLAHPEVATMIAMLAIPDLTIQEHAAVIIANLSAHAPDVALRFASGGVLEDLIPLLRSGNSSLVQTALLAVANLTANDGSTMAGASCAPAAAEVAKVLQALVTATRLELSVITAAIVSLANLSFNISVTLPVLRLRDTLQAVVRTFRFNDATIIEMCLTIFINTFDGVGADSHDVAVHMASSAPTLLHLFQASPQQETRDRALLLITKIADTDEGRKELVAAGAHKVLLREISNETPLASLALAILAHLTVSEANAVRAMGAVGTLLPFLLADVAEAREHALTVLANMLPEQQSRLLQSIAQSSGATADRAQCCTALLYSKDDEMRLFGVGVLASLAADASQRQPLRDANAAQALVALMNSQPKGNDLLQRAMLAIANLACDELLGDAFSDTVLIRSVISCTRSFEENVQLPALIAVHNLSMSDQVREVLITSGVVDAVSACLGIASVAVNEIAAACISALVTYDVRMREACIVALAPLAALLRADESAVVWQACHALALLARTESARQWLHESARASALSALQQLAVKGPVEIRPWAGVASAEDASTYSARVKQVPIFELIPRVTPPSWY
eukprot:TRINITY_DN1101_c0_g1_i1.p1 TRINITY_DN1101_c0_g1~~TRINITY_DN1101_c0_g1_i1.p1  ORF type:complete len:1651 (-),score=436.86 TRINITY_DN1101_c0_g1_i1:495-5447(-)